MLMASPTFFEAFLLAAGLMSLTLIVALVPKPPVQREIRENPLAASGLFTGTAIVVALLLQMASRSYIAMLLVGLSGLAVAVLAFIRSRPNYGTGRGLPPGSLALISSLDSLSDPDFYLAAAARWGPVFKMSQFHRPVICVVDLKIGLEVLSSEKDSLEPCQQSFQRFIPGGYIEFMKGQQHTHYREILTKGIRHAIGPDWKLQLGPVFRKEFNRMATAGTVSGAIPAEYINAMVFQSLIHLFFGVAPGDDRYNRFKRLYDGFDHNAFSWRSKDDQVKILGQLVKEVQDVTETAGSRLASNVQIETSVLTEILRTNPDNATDPTVVGNLVFMLQIGRLTGASLLLWLLKMGCDNPDALHRIRLAEESGDAAAADKLATNFVYETLRLSQSEYVYRKASRDCWIGDMKIPKGWMLRVCLREAHRRGDVFSDPLTFNPDRFATHKYDKTEFCPFGEGVHACLAVALILTIARTFVVELSRTYQWRVTSDGLIERDNRHWSHWHPSNRFKVQALTGQYL
jgi:cytochrome P450